MPSFEWVDEGGTVQSRALGAVELLIGRARTADVVLRHPKVSSDHLKAWVAQGQVWVEDLGARNGTRLNGLELKGRAAIRPGDVVSLGGAIDLRLVLDHASAVELPSEIRSAIRAATGGDHAGETAAVEALVAGLIAERDAARAVGADLGRYVRAAKSGNVLQCLVEHAAELADVPVAWAIRWSGDPDGGTASIDAMATAGESPDAPDPSELSRSILFRVAREQRAVWSDDAASEPGLRDAKSVQALRLRSVGCVPLGPAAALWVSDPELPDRFDPETRARLEALCALVAPLLEAEAPAGRSEVTPRVRPIPGVVGQSPAVVGLAQSVHAFAPMPWPILILGETGTGKELVARGIHDLSGRRGEFLAVNCGAIPENLAESTIFGHERGAFTGADRRHQGVVERVGRGTLFLDEIGDLPGPLQVKLLRLLQEGTFTAVGGTQVQTFHGRIVAATHRPIDTPEGRTGFREDLYYRLAACVVRVPALRERRDDIPALAQHLVERAARQLPGIDGLRLGQVALQQLRFREWPGNVRELENAIRPAIARCVASGAREIGPEHFVDPSSPAAGGGAAGPAPWDVDDLMEATEIFQRERVRQALAEHRGNRTAACEALGVSRQWFYRLLARWPEHQL